MNEFINTSFMFNELKKYNPETIIKKYEELEELDLLIERLYYLSQDRNLLISNLDIVSKMEQVINILRNAQYKKDYFGRILELDKESFIDPDVTDESKEMFHETIDKVESACKASDYEKDMESYYWATREFMIRKLPKKVSHKLVAPAVSEVVPYVQKDFDIFNVIVNEPNLLGAFDTVYVLSTINKLIGSYPEVIKENEVVKSNIMSYLYSPVINVSRKDKNKIVNMYEETLNNFVEFIYSDEKKRTLVK